MGRVDPDPVAGSGPQTHEGAGLGAVAVQHVRLQFADHALEPGPHQKITRQRLTANGCAMNAELELGSDFRQRLLGAFAAGQAVGDDADVMAAVGLAVGEIEDMAENAADRRARGVQDPKRLTVNERHRDRLQIRARSGWVGACSPQAPAQQPDMELGKIRRALREPWKSMPRLRALMVNKK